MRKYTNLSPSRNLPVLIKPLGFKRLRVYDDVRKEVALMKEARHANLVELVGLCVEPHRTLIVEGKQLHSPIERY